jgi:hypothetical protein
VCTDILWIWMLCYFAVSCRDFGGVSYSGCCVYCGGGGGCRMEQPLSTWPVRMDI